MWDEDPRWQEGNYRLILGSLRVAFIVGAVLGLVFATWEPLLQFCYLVGAAVGSLFVVWVLPVWLFGKLVDKLRSGVQHD